MSCGASGRRPPPRRRSRCSVEPAQGARRRVVGHPRARLHARYRPGAARSRPLRATRGGGAERARVGDPERAAERLREGLALWRGPPLADFGYESFAQATIARLEEERRGRSRTASTRTSRSAGTRRWSVSSRRSSAEHPLRERLHGQLMLALYRSGRQADALERYQRARRRLVDELGIEPGSALSELERAILAHDPEARGSRASVTATVGQACSAWGAADRRRRGGPAGDDRAGSGDAQPGRGRGCGSRPTRSR